MFAGCIDPDARQSFARRTGNGWDNAAAPSANGSSSEPPGLSRRIRRRQPRICSRGGAGHLEEVELAVIGVRFAGLNAALQVARAGLSVRLLEARDGVGGRVVNHALADGRMIEAGGQFIGPTQNRIYDVAREFGVGTFDAFDESGRTGNALFVVASGCVAASRRENCWSSGSWQKPRRQRGPALGRYFPIASARWRCKQSACGQSSASGLDGGDRGTAGWPW